MEQKEATLVATILIFSDYSWQMEFSDDVSNVIKFACYANMENNWDDETEYFENNPDLCGD